MVSSGFCSCFNVKIVKSTQAISSTLWRLILIFQLRLWPYTSCKWTESFPERIRCIFFYHGTLIWKAAVKNWKSLSFEPSERFAEEFSTWCWELSEKFSEKVVTLLLNGSKFVVTLHVELCLKFFLCEWTTLIWLFSNRNISSNQSKNFQRKQWVRKRFISTSSLSAT